MREEHLLQVFGLQFALLTRATCKKTTAGKNEGEQWSRTRGEGCIE